MNQLQSHLVEGGWILPLSIASDFIPASTESLEEMARYIQNGWMVVWQHHGVFVMPVEGGTFIAPSGMEPDQQVHLVRARAFSPNCEWHVWRTEDGFQGRKREDSAGETFVEVVDAEAKLRGVVVRQLDSRHPDAVWVLASRNYVGYNAFGHAGYVDSRFMDIKIGKENKL
jgi:hypothetical protein